MSCCGTRYYCTAAGPVAVEPDADGWYAVPDGGTSGWYKTYEEAEGVCPPPPLVVECGEGEIEVPQVMFVTLTDLTGDFIGLFPSNSVACPMSVITGGAFGEGSITDGNGNTWRAEVAVNCAAAGCGGAGFYQVVVLFGPDTCNGIGTVYTGTAASGWTADGGGTSEIQYLACRAVGDPVTASGGEEVYSAVVDCVTQGVAGTFTVNLS